jgi:hypothetical protein
VKHTFTKWCLSSALLLAACISARAADPQTAWEQAIQAKGGLQRLQGVKTLAVYMKPADVVLAGPPANWLCVFPNQYFEWEGGRGNQHSIVVDATADRMAMDANGRPRGTGKLTPMQRDRLVLNQLLYLLETAWLRPEPLAVKQTLLHLHRETLLTVRAGGRTFDLYLNSSNLPDRIISRRGEGSKTKYDYQMERYREFQGILLPTRVIYTVNSRQWIWDADYEIDAKYNPKLFERMPDLADGPEPWRRR